MNNLVYEPISKIPDDLMETVELMNSDDYKRRFAAEYAQLKIRLKKLNDMLDRLDSGDIRFIPTSPVDLLRVQAKAMKTYLGILDARAIIEDVFVDLDA